MTGFVTLALIAGFSFFCGAACVLVFAAVIGGTK